jgi:hypothetical protein
MASIAIDRTDGLSSSTAIKGPCRVATTANIALSGTQTIDGVAVVVDDRVLVKDQTAPSENGIYVVDTGPWRRAKDFEKTRDVRKGTRVAITDGTVLAKSVWAVSANNPIGVGIDNITFEAVTFGQFGVLDEDDMASDSADDVPTQQSVKAYVDAGPSTSALQATMRDRLDTAPYTATRASMKTLNTAKDTVAILAGVAWLFSSSNLSSLVSADPREAYYVAPASDATGASGAWVRQRDNLDVNVRDFGAVADGATNDQPAIQAALNFLKTQGGGVLRIPASPSNYKINSGLSYDVSALVGRFNSRIRIVGDGSSVSCLSMTGVASAALTITGSSSSVEMHCHLEGFRITGNNTVGSKGLVLSINGFGSSDDIVLEAFDYNLDCTDVEQIALYNSNFRWGLHGARFNAAAATSSANSIVLQNCSISNNSKWGLQVTNGNAFTMIGGSVQYNGTTGGGATEWGAKFTEVGNGYGTVAFIGVAFEGNGGDADLISEQSAYIAAFSLVGCGFARPNSSAYATNFMQIAGTTASTYSLLANTFRGYNSYVANAGRPYFSVTNAAAKIHDDGTNVYGSATEQPAWAGSTQIPASLTPQANDGGALGAATRSWSDLFLASGGVLNFNNGNYTVTHSAGTLTFSGGASWGGALLPATDDGAALGSLTFRWSDAFFAAGGVLTFGSNDMALTHVGGSQLRLAGNFSRAAPVTKTGNFTVGVAENWLIVNQAGSTTVTLPSAATWNGREIMIKTIQAQTVVSASSNVVPRAGGAAGTAILAAAAGNWATLVSDGTNWQIMAGS